MTVLRSGWKGYSICNVLSSVSAHDAFIAPRLFAIVIHCELFSCGVVAGHVPLDEGIGWWKLLGMTLADRWFQGLPTTWPFDGNARVMPKIAPGCVAPVADGHVIIPVTSVASNNVSQGQKLLAQLIHHSMWLP